MGKSQYKRMASAVNFEEQLKVTSGFKALPKPNPRNETTSNFYKDQNKKAKGGPVQIGKRKEPELEAEHWTDKVFTGDNPKLTAFLSGQARDRESLYNTDYKKRRVVEEQTPNRHGSPTKNKQDINAEAD
jgi:hypothetical protein